MSKPTDEALGLDLNPVADPLTSQSTRACVSRASGSTAVTSRSGNRRADQGNPCASVSLASGPLEATFRVQAMLAPPAPGVAGRAHGQSRPPSVSPETFFTTTLTDPRSLYDLGAAAAAARPGDDDEEAPAGGEPSSLNNRELEEEEEEAATPRMAKDPSEPTRAEREAHQATHLPYRSWCAACCGPVR